MGYNSLKQLTSLNSSGGITVAYAYPSVGNNCKISTETDGGSASDQPTYAFPWGQGYGNLINASVTQGTAPPGSPNQQAYDTAIWSNCFK